MNSILVKPIFIQRFFKDLIIYSGERFDAKRDNLVEIKLLDFYKWLMIVFISQTLKLFYFIFSYSYRTLL